MVAVTVITNCSARKSIDMSIVQARLGKVPGFDLENEEKYRQVLSDFVRPAIDMYDGPIFRVLRGYRQCIDVFVLSARYGVIHGDRPIIPYDAYLKDAGTWVLSTWSRYGNYDLQKLLGTKSRRYIIVMSGQYLDFLLRVLDPCSLGGELYLITSVKPRLKCSATWHEAKRPGEFLSALSKLLGGFCSSSLVLDYFMENGKE